MFKLVLTTQCFPPDVGGIETYMGDIAHFMQAHGVDVTVFADRAKRETTRGDVSYAVRRFGGPRPLRRRFKAYAIRRAIAADPDCVVLADTWKSLEVLDVPETPVVLLAHGNEFLLPPGTAKFRRAQRAINKADLILANSAFTAGLLQQFGIARHRVHIFNIPVAEQAPASEAARAALAAELAGFAPCLVTVSRLEKRKGVDRVIALLPRLLSAYPKLGYVIGGDGPYRADLEALAAQQGVSASVRFLGRVDHDRKAAMLERADLFVMPTRIEPRSVEGFGISYMEAAWYGVPAVATDAGGARDAVLDRETGLVAAAEDDNALYDAIDTLLRSETLRRTYGANAQARARDEMNWDKGVMRLMALLDLARQRRRAASPQAMMAPHPL